MGYLRAVFVVVRSCAGQSEFSSEAPIWPLLTRNSELAIRNRREWGVVKRTEREVASRCLRDPAYALVVLDAEEYPAVRAALQADLEDAGEGQMVQNPSPIPPDVAWWQSLTFPRLRALAERPTTQPA